MLLKITKDINLMQMKIIQKLKSMINNREILNKLVGKIFKLVMLLKQFVMSLFQLIFFFYTVQSQKVVCILKLKIQMVRQISKINKLIKIQSTNLILIIWVRHHLKLIVNFLIKQFINTKVCLNIKIIKFLLKLITLF